MFTLLSLLSLIVNQCFFQENFGGVFSSMVTLFCSQHILNKRTISYSGTILLFKVSFGNNFIVFYNCNKICSVLLCKRIEKIVFFYNPKMKSLS